MLTRYVHAVLIAGRRISTEAVAPAKNSGAGASKRRGKDSLGRRLFSLEYAKESPIIAIRQWQEEGNTVHKYELDSIGKELRKSQRHELALQVCEWMTQQPDIKLLPGDYAVQFDLIAKIRGLASAEKFLEDLPDQMRNPTYTALLHTFVRNKETAKAEAVLEKMSKSGFLKCPHPYNRLLSFYISTGQRWKVVRMVEELKKNTLPDVTYNIFLSLCTSRVNVFAAEEIVRVLNESKIKPNWKTYGTLTKLYIKKSLPEKAASTLKEIEKMASQKNRTAYSYLIQAYAKMEDKDEVWRILKKMRECLHKMTDAEYVCILSSFVKLGELEEAENLYFEWESIAGSNDARVSNVLLAAYVDKKDIRTVEKFYNRMVEKGITPIYNTWKLLACAYMKEKQIGKSLGCFKIALRCVEKWVPNKKLVVDMFKKLENVGDVERAEQLLSILREAGYVSTKVYNLLLKTYAKAGIVPHNIAERMEKDNVGLDEETRKLIRITSKLSVSDV